MKAHVGDRIAVESERVAQPPRRGIVEEVLQEEPQRLRVRWDDGHESVFYPGNDARVERAAATAAGTAGTAGTAA